MKNTIQNKKEERTKNKEGKIMTLLPSSIFFVLSSIFFLPSSIFFPGLGVPAAQAQSASMPSAVRQGYNLLNKGWVNDAIKAFRQAIVRHPDSVDAKLGLAIALQRSGKDAEAWDAYQKVLDVAPNNQAALKAVGVLGGYRSEWQVRGIDALTILLKLTPNDTEARAQRALLLGYQSRFSESISEYEILLQNKPSPETILGAAQIYTFSRDYQKGLELFNRYRATGKQISKYQIAAYAQALIGTGNEEQAIQVLRTQLGQLKADDSVTVDIRAALAEAYQINQQLPQALEVLQPLRGRKEATLPLARSLSQIGRRTQRMDLYAEAIILYRQVLATTPSPSVSLVTEVADVLSESPQDREEARKLYQQLLAREPNNRGLSVKLLALESQMGVLSAGELRQRLSAIMETAPTGTAEQRAIAQVLLRLEPPDPELLPIYQTLVASGVDEPFLNYRVAQIYVEQGKFAEAKQALLTYSATSMGQRDLAPLLLLADIERRQGNLDASAQQYQAIIAREDAPNTIVNDALRALVGIRLTQNRAEEAIAIYDQILARNPQDMVSQLGRASVAYQAKRMSVEEAEAILNQWLTSEAANNTPPELFSLVAVLPPAPEREKLYNTLLNIQPDNLPIQLRLVQVIAKRDPAAAKQEVAQLIARDPENIGAYFLQGQLGQTLEDLDLAAKSYDSILARQPQNVDAMSALAGVRFQQRRFAEANRLYRQILAIQPQNRIALASLAELTAAQDKPLEAIQNFKKLQQTGDNSDAVLQERIERLQVDWLQRRSFQPYWERY
jgi:tetratricopeptide (TPR) repeat protein